MPRHSFILYLIIPWLLATIPEANGSVVFNSWASRNPWDNQNRLDPSPDSRLSHQLAYRNRLYNIFLSDAQYLREAPALANAIWTRLLNRCNRWVGSSDLKDAQSNLQIPVNASRRLCKILSETRAQLKISDSGLEGFRISADTFLHLHIDISAGSDSSFSVREIALPGDLFIPDVYSDASYPVGENHPTVERATQALLTLFLGEHPEAQKVKQSLWMMNGCHGSLKPRRCGPDFIQNLVRLWNPLEVRMVSNAQSSGWWDCAARFIQKAERDYKLREGLPARLAAPADIVFGADARNGIYRVRAHEIRSRALWGAEQHQFRGTACGDPKAERWLSRAAAASVCVSIPLKSLLSEQTLGFIQDKLLKNFGAGSLHTRSNADKLLILSNKAVATAATGAFVWFGWRLASLFAPAKVSQVAGLVGGTSTVGAVSHAAPYAAVAKRAYGAVALLELLGLAWPGLEKWMGQPASRALYWLTGGDLFAASWAWVDEAMDSQNRDLNHRSRVLLAESLEALGKAQSSVESRTLTEEEFARLSGSGGTSGGFFDLWSAATASNDKRECGIRPQAPAYLIQLPRALCEVCDRSQAKSPEACLKEVLDLQMRDQSASSLVFGRLLDRDQKLSQAEKHLQSLEHLTLEWTGVAAKLNGKRLKSPPVAAPKSVEDESPVLWIDH